MAFKVGAGAEVQRPLATVVLGHCLLDTAHPDRAPGPVSPRVSAARVTKLGVYTEGKPRAVPCDFRYPSAFYSGGAGPCLCFEMSAVLRYFGPIAGILYEELVSSAD